MNTVQKRFTKHEESANFISHGIGFLLSIVAAIAIVNRAINNDNAWHIFSTLVFGASLIFLYLSSSMNHSLVQGKRKDFYHNIDQIAIYLLIAGTYTPIALCVIKNNGGWVMLGIEWGLALVGIFIKILVRSKFERGVATFTILSYVIMGWLLLFFITPLANNLSTTSFILLFIGGLFYTLGILFFKLEKLAFSHLIWHLFVICGSACHWLAIYLYL